MIVLINFDGLTQKHPGMTSQSLSRVQISTMAVKDNLIVAGGFQGELICKVCKLGVKNMKHT